MAVRRRSKKVEIDIARTIREALKHPARRTILEALYQLKEASLADIHPIAIEKSLKSNGKAPFPSTVYQILTGFERLGIARSRIIMVQKDRWRKTRIFSLTEEARKAYEEALRQAK